MHVPAWWDIDKKRLSCDRREKDKGACMREGGSPVEMLESKQGRRLPAKKLISILTLWGKEKDMCDANSAA